MSLRLFTPISAGILMLALLLPSTYLLAQENVATTTEDKPYKLEQLTGEQNFNDFVVGPGKFELELAPGESETVRLTVANRTGEVKRFKLGYEDMQASNDPAQTVTLLGDDVGPYTLKDYLSVEAEEFDLEHGERAVIPVTVSLPPDVDPGSHYGSVVVSTVAKEAEEGSVSGAPRSAVVSRIGVLFFISAPGEQNQNGQLEDFSILNNKKFFTNGPITMNLLYRNTGTVHLNPYGEISITNMLGNEVEFIELSPWFTLPDSLRSREVVWNREFMFGRYTATAKINRGYQDIVDEAVVTFWVVPTSLLLSVFAALFVLFLFIRLITNTFEIKRKV